MRAVVLALMAVTACEGGRRPAIDAGPDARRADAAEECPAPGTGTPNFFGEACTEADAPAVTECHGGAGWCIAGVCRPMCNGFGCRRCDFGTYTISDRGACYCAP